MTADSRESAGIRTKLNWSKEKKIKGQTQHSRMEVEATETNEIDSGPRRGDKPFRRPAAPGVGRDLGVDQTEGVRDV
jgi:hypothetical protein